MNSEVISGAAGVLLSLAFSYIPGLSTKFAALDGTAKRLVMAILIIAIGCVVFALDCFGVYSNVGCTKDGATQVIAYILTALVANQSTYAISPTFAKKA